MEHNKTHHSQRRVGTAHRHHINGNFNSLHNHGTSLYHTCNNTSTSSERTFRDFSHTATVTASSQPTTPSARRRTGNAFGCWWRPDCREPALTRKPTKSKPQALHVRPNTVTFGTSCSAPSVACNGQQQARLPSKTIQSDRAKTGARSRIVCQIQTSRSRQYKHQRRRVHVVTQKQRRAGKGLTST